MAGSRIHTAESPGGPWTPLLNSTLPSCTNPAPFVHHSAINPSIPSSVYILCNHTYLFRSPNLWGPWKYMTQVTPDEDSDGNRYEDPDLYIDHRGFHVLYHEYNPRENLPPGHDCHNSTVSALFYSRDGKAWHQSPRQPYTNHVRTNSSSYILVATMERPSLVLRQHPATGHLQPTHLVTAVSGASRCPGVSPKGCVDCKFHAWDYTLVQPLGIA